MTRLAGILGRAIAIAGLVGGLAASPALADHDDHGKHHWKHQGQHREYRRPQAHYYSRDYDRYHYRRPYVQYYAPPVYVPPPPSFGLNLVFPIH